MRRNLPWIVAGLALWAVLPLVVPRNIADLLVFTGIYTVAGLGIGLLLGHCGIVNLAQATFYGIGAYSSAYCTVMMGLPSPTGFVVGAVLSMVLAYVIGRPILRLTGYFLALGTLALSAITSALFFEWDWLTGGTLGIGGIPKLDLLGFVLDRPSRFYYFVWIVAFACMAMAHNLVDSRTGLMLRAMRDSSTAAASLTVDLQGLRTRVFVVCALFGSLAGSLFAHHASFVSTQSFTVERSISFLLIPVIGGATSLPGVVAGAVFVTFLPDFLSKLGDFHQILFGLALVGVVVAMPNGLVGVAVRLWQSLRARRSGHAG
ncbi:branched-chain amino acid ABC transporter permease [Vineibacter terrae]|uniref:branched-chain amino acid ABC transporter permease n=1 Tax=Vineibacter terrae TaxID=2586908 RepID=UPI002E352204|nr:branched-chain amino acid ABC transporter permease [Vineibacter terrae]HEX2890332.1 branched-chain amino acid ABC transporter permease [Vineibacter terrae]